MLLKLTPALEERLQTLAAGRECSAESLLSEILDSYLTHIEELTSDVHEAEESAEREGWVPHEEVVARINQRLARSA